MEIMISNTNEINLGHGILDCLPRGVDGERMSAAIRNRIVEVLAEERKACSDIALAIDSGRGNEKEIAKAILRRGEVSADQGERVPYAWEIVQNGRTFLVSAQEFTRSSYDTGTFKPLFD